MSDKKLKEILAKVKSFSTMPGAGFKMLALLQELEPELTEIEEILRYDPGLTANVLKAAGGNAIELSPAVIDRLEVQLDQFETISGKVAQWVDELSDAPAFN